MKNSKNKIINECNEIKKLLLEKNKKYGDSALNPIRVFSKSDTVEQLKVRIDDKLKRIQNMWNKNIKDKNESVSDSIRDLTGYLILLLISENEK